MSYDPTNNDESLHTAAEGQERSAAEPAPEVPMTAAVDAGPPPTPPPSPPADGFNPLFDDTSDEAGASRTAGQHPAAPSRKTMVGAGIGAAVIALGAVVGINLASSGAENASTADAAAGGMTGAPGAAPGGVTQDGAAPGGMTGGPGGPGGGTSGTVERIDGSTVSIAGQDGSTVSVATTDETVVALSETGSADDIDEGDQVLVMGTADGDAIAAERVIDQGDTATDADTDQAGPPGGMSGSASGEVSGVDGDSFTVSTADGDVTVTMTDATTIVVETSGSIDDLDEGDTVMVRGETDDDGTVTATRIIAGDLPQGGPGGPAMGGLSGQMPAGPPAQSGTTDGGTGTTGQAPAAPGGTTGSAGQPAGVPATGGATTT